MLSNLLLLRTIGLVAMTAAGFFGMAEYAVGQEQGGGDGMEQLFERQNFPWYDAESGQVQPVRFPESTKPASLDRDQIPVAVSVDEPDENEPTAYGDDDHQILSKVVWGFVALGILALIGLFVWAVLRLRSNEESLTRRGPVARSLEESIRQLPFQVDEKRGGFQELARAAYARGDFRQAIIYLYSHVLVTLDQNSLIRLQKGKTNRQYLREIKAYRSLAQFFQTVMVPFEATFFGDHDLSQSEFEVCWQGLAPFHRDVHQINEERS